MQQGQLNFLDLPVYRLTNEEYYAKRNAYVDSVMTKHPLATTPRNPSVADKLSKYDESMRDHLFNQYGGTWRYNEIIGFLRLHLLGSQIRAEYWRSNAKRIVRTRRKIFEFWHWKVALETEIPAQASSSEIYEAVLAHVDQCRTALRGRYIDTEVLETLGPHINWQTLFHGI